MSEATEPIPEVRGVDGLGVLRAEMGAPGDLGVRAMRRRDGAQFVPESGDVVPGQ